MAEELTDNTGASVTVELDLTDPISSYSVRLADGTRAGRADFVDSPGTAERIFFHTEVNPQFGGRGLAGLLVRAALADSIRRNLTVVPVCPLFARHLQTHGEEFVAEVSCASRRPPISTWSHAPPAAGRRTRSPTRRRHDRMRRRSTSERRRRNADTRGEEHGCGRSFPTT